MIEAIVKPADRMRFLQATVRVYKVAYEEVTDNQQMRSSMDLRQRLMANILTQRYGGSYAPYSPRYAQWKQSSGYLYPGWWMLGGYLLRSLTSQRWTEGWYAGVAPGATGERGRPIAIYGAAGEFADIRENQPARPMFTPTTYEYAVDPNGWKKRGEETLRKVENAWR